MKSPDGTRPQLGSLRGCGRERGDVAALCVHIADTGGAALYGRERGERECVSVRVVERQRER